MAKILLEQAEKEPPIEVSDADELDHLLAEIASNTSPEHPVIVFVYAYGFQVGIGLGHTESFVHFESASGEPPYIITVGDRKAKGVLAFYLLGNHHTEISQRYLIPISRAREIVRGWLQTGVRPLGQQWEEV
jgi:hypothetical protein